MVTVTDEEQDVTPALVEACRRGDRDAFRLLYEGHKDRVYSIALYFFHGDRATAADVTQHVFLKLLDSIGQFRGDSAFSTWLYRFVVNACVDRTRTAGARARAVDAAILDTIARPASQEEALAGKETARAVQAAISALAPKVRIAILLRYFDELSYEEMAAALKCSIGTVASRLNRGHAILARSLAPLRDSLGRKDR
jgi:RNA polymerase sigma-70 factor (ECF subfamily)